MIKKEKLEELQTKLEKYGIKESDLIEKFILGSGSGGQKINKTSSCVYLKHLPSGIEVKCQKDRSREMNRFFARKQLLELLLEKEHQAQTERQKLQHKIRRQKKRRSRRSKEKILADKKRHSEKKALRHFKEI